MIRMAGVSDYDLPPFPRGRIKIRRVRPGPDGTIEEAPAATPDAWWQSVLADERGRGMPLDFDTLWFNRDDTADLSCDDCKMSKSVRIVELLNQPGNTASGRVSDAIGTYVNCPRRAKRCRLGYSLRNRRR